MTASLILSNLYFVLLLIYIYSSEKCKIKVGLETVDVFLPKSQLAEVLHLFLGTKVRGVAVCTDIQCSKQLSPVDF